MSLSIVGKAQRVNLKTNQNEIVRDAFTLPDGTGAFVYFSKIIPSSDPQPFNFRLRKIDASGQLSASEIVFAEPAIGANDYLAEFYFAPLSNGGFAAIMHIERFTQNGQYFNVQDLIAVQLYTSTGALEGALQILPIIQEISDVVLRPDGGFDLYAVGGPGFVDPDYVTKFSSTGALQSGPTTDPLANNNQDIQSAYLTSGETLASTQMLFGTTSTANLIVKFANGTIRTAFISGTQGTIEVEAFEATQGGAAAIAVVRLGGELLKIYHVTTAGITLVDEIAAVSSATNNRLSVTDLQQLPNGSFALAYSETAADGSVRAFVQALSATGEAYGQRFELDSLGGWDGYHELIVANGDLYAFVTASAGASPPNKSDVYLQRFDIGAAPISTASTIEGTTGDDFLAGIGGDDTLNGLAGNDVLQGGTGNDTENGGSGDDTFIMGAGNDDIDGGEGSDTVDYDRSTSGVTLDLAGIEAPVLPAAFGSDTLVSIENVSGGRAWDKLFGNDGDNRLAGRDGSDLLYGRGGNDVLEGGAGNDSLFGDVGLDTAVYSDAEAGISINLGSNGQQFVTNGLGYDFLFSIENLIGGDFDDELFGDDGANVLSGGEGNDKLFGLGGDDTLDGGAGNDELDGGDGLDTADYSAAQSGLFLDLRIPSPQISTGGLGTDMLMSVENLIGGEFDDSLLGTIGANTLSGGKGNDVLRGERGDDVLDGGEGNDRLNGDAGIDVMRGRSGDDLYYVDNAGDVIEELAGEGGRDRVVVFSNYVLASQAEVEIIYIRKGAGVTQVTGSDTANKMIGANGSETLRGAGGDDRLYGFDGSDTLIGGIGADEMHGGTGDDRYYVDNADDVVVELLGEGAKDRLVTSVDYVLAAQAEIETIEIAEGSGATLVAGSDTDNIMFGAGGNETLLGRGGDDRLQGLDGDDTLDGGAGIDVLLGGAGADHFVLGTQAASRDRIRDFEIGVDKLILDSSIFIGLTPGSLDPDAFHSYAAGTPVTTEHRFIFDHWLGALYYDVNGSESGGRAYIANLDYAAGLSASDFLVI